MQENHDLNILAHNLSDTTILRSKDVELTNNCTFKDMKLANETLTGLEKCGFERPSPIQYEAIPLGRCGFDLVIQSKAGTGKTCVMGVIALEAVQSKKNVTQTIIIAPTREIAIQIHQVISLIGSKYNQLKCCLCIGGVKVDVDRKQLSGNYTRIVVGTPGRVKQLIELNILTTQHIELFVLDEADKLMDDQFKVTIDEIYRRLPKDKQMVVVSATYPDELSIFLRQYMKDAKFVRVGTELSLEAVREFYIQCKAGHSSKTTLENKLRILRYLLGLEISRYKKCFVFTNFQARAPIICDSLNKDPEFVNQNGITSYISAELSQEERSQIFHQFRNSKERKVLLSTDLSARGIDIEDAELVINFDIPFDNETYYHRIGRAGRFGKPGAAITIVTSGPMDIKQFANTIKSDRISLLPTYCDT